MNLDPFDGDDSLLEDFSRFTFADDGVVLFSADQDVKRLDLGGGMNFPLFRDRPDQLDLVVRGAYSDIDYDSFEFGSLGGGRFSDLTDDATDGYFGDARLRTQLLDWLEVSGGTALYQHPGGRVPGNIAHAQTGNPLPQILPGRPGNKKTPPAPADEPGRGAALPSGRPD